MVARNKDKFRFSSNLLAAMEPTSGELDRARGWVEASPFMNPEYWTPRQIQHIMAGYIGRMRDEQQVHETEG